MLKETITYTNFDDEEVTKILHFNIAQVEITENMHLRDEFMALAERFDGTPRTLTPEEVRLMVDIVKKIMQLSYGVREGELFKKDDPPGSGDIWKEFTQTAAYDAFFMSLFKSEEKLTQWILNVFPANLREAAKAEVAKYEAMRASLPVAPPLNKYCSCGAIQFGEGAEHKPECAMRSGDPVV